MKDVSPASAYIALIPRATEVARESGYALAVHGSVGRDLDLIAAPWTDEAVSAEALILALLGAFGFMHAHMSSRKTEQEAGQPSGDLPAKKPHGRLAWTINFDNGLYLDVSVMPRLGGK